MIVETRKYICDECGNAFEANANTINPLCTVCQNVHIENPGFNPDMSRNFPQQNQEMIAAIPTNNEVEEILSNFDPEYDYKGGD